MRATTIILLLLCGCAAETDAERDIAADVEPLTSCWNSTLITTTPGWPPLDMFVSARAMQSWQGGSWKACTDNAQDTKVICKRLVGTPQVVGYWNYCIPSGGPQCLMSVYYDPDASEQNHIHGFQVWTTDWDDNVYTHGVISPAEDNSFSSGTVDVTHLSGNNWQVHTCITQ
jgi:hypothetical protein